MRTDSGGASGALGKVLRFRVYLLFKGTKVEPVCADLRDQRCPLRETVVHQSSGPNWLCSAWAARPALTCVSMHVSEGFCRRGPVTSGSLHHWRSPPSSGSPLLLLPLFLLLLLSSNSVAVYELRRDPKAASSVIKSTSSEDASCHLKCLFWAHVTSNCRAVISEYYQLLSAQPISLSFVTSIYILNTPTRGTRRHIADCVSILHISHAY